MATETVKEKKGRGGATRQSRTEVNAFDNRVKTLLERGFSVLAPAHVTEISMEGSSSESRLGSGGMIGGGAIQQTFSLFDEAQSHPMPVENAGTKGLGYIPWGPGNKLPNLIYSLVASLPYTAAAIKYIADLTVGGGPALMYRWARYVGGSVKEELIPYENAGVLISNRMREVRDQLTERNQNNPPDASGRTVKWSQAIGAEPTDEPESGTLEFEVKQLKEDYATWTSTMKEYEKFMEDNDLGLHYLKCMTDDTHMDIYFPTIGLSVGRAQEAWNPKIVRIGHLPAVCTRMEEMDERLHVNNVYYSERWRADATVKLQAQEITSYPALMPENRLSDLRSIVRKNQNSSTRRRPTWFCCPTYYPSLFRPYYPQPAWWSIFPSKAYEYASTLITDKATMRQNSTMWGKMIFINNEYLQAMFSDAGADTQEEKEAIRNRIYNNVNSFLMKRENSGKTICLDSFLSNDGKTLMNAVEIIDVPQVSSSKDLKDELEEISSIIFFAIGVHPALIGAVPGKSSSTGGTFQREIQLLKQNQVSPRQRIYLKWLQNIHAFNRWDKHGVWVIKQQVLTTLDRNPSGTEDTESR